MDTHYAFRNTSTGLQINLTHIDFGNFMRILKCNHSNLHDDQLLLNHHFDELAWLISRIPWQKLKLRHVLSGYVFTSRVQTLYTCFVWVRVYQSSPDFVYMFCLGTCLPVESRLCIHVLSGYVFTSRVQTLYTCFVWVRVYQSSPDFVYMFCLGTCLPVESRLCIHVLSGYVFTSRVQTLYDYCI